MRLLDRHLFWETLLATAGAVGLFAGVLVAGNALKELAPYLAQGQISLGLFLRLLVLLVPFVASYALPLGLLTGVLLVMGRHAAQQEITAMRSAGLGLHRIAAPVLLIALGGVALAVVVNFHYGPVARGVYRSLLGDAVRANPLGFLVEKTFIRDFPGYTLYIGRKDGDAFEDFWLWELDARRRTTKMLRAQRGRIVFDREGRTLDLVLEGGQTEFRDGPDPEDFRRPHPALAFESTTIRLPLDRILGTQSLRRSTSWMTLPELRAEDRALAATLATDPAADPVGLERRRLRLRMIVQERFAMAFAVLSFALVAFPLAVRFRRRETSASLALAVALALLYYLLVIFIKWLDRMPEARPEILLWVPNLLYQAAGLWLLRRADHT